jgi:hypothetical protein
MAATSKKEMNTTDVIWFERFSTPSSGLKAVTICPHCEETCYSAPSISNKVARGSNVIARCNKCCKEYIIRGKK